LRKWIVAAVIAASLAALEAAAIAQQGAASRETAQASGVKQEKAGSAGGIQTFVPPDLAWEDNPDVSGVQNAVGVGDPTQPELYTSFGKIEDGVKFPAHTHPDARITTVLSGIMHYGIGERFDRTRFEPYPAGSVIYTPPGTPHIMWAKSGEIVVQETGYGPTDIEFASDAE